MLFDTNLLVRPRGRSYAFDGGSKKAGDGKMKKVVGLALATLVAVPAFAQERNADRMSAARAAAIHQSSVAASRYTEHTSGNMEFDQYRACMAEHGQVE